MAEQTNITQKGKVEDTYRLYADDEKYKALITAHEALSEDESNDLNRKTLLLLLETVEKSDLEGVLNRLKKNTI